MSNGNLTADDGYQSLLGKISDVYISGQMRVTQAVNAHITETYWRIGHDIVEFEQGGNVRAEYGKRLVATLAKDSHIKARQGVLPQQRHDDEDLLPGLPKSPDAVWTIELVALRRTALHG